MGSKVRVIPWSSPGVEADPTSDGGDFWASITVSAVVTTKESRLRGPWRVWGCRGYGRVIWGFSRKERCIRTGNVTSIGSRRVSSMVQSYPLAGVGQPASGRVGSTREWVRQMTPHICKREEILALQTFPSCIVGSPSLVRSLVCVSRITIIPFDLRALPCNGMTEYGPKFKIIRDCRDECECLYVRALCSPQQAGYVKPCQVSQCAETILKS
jgi:hypothetical protein